MSFKKWLGSTPKEKDPLQCPQSQPSTRNGSVSQRSSVSSKVDSLNHLEATPSHGVSELAEVEEEEDDTTLNVTEDLPFGDGSNKIFGMENFGNTCYCNSILQCLYYTSDFRLNVLIHPPKELPRVRRTSMPGSKPHPATKVELSDLEKEKDKETDNKVQKTSLGRRTSNFFGRNKRDSNDDEEETPTVPVNPSNPATQPSPNTTIITIPNIRTSPTRVVVGQTDDPSSSVDVRKKTALIRGPIINMDHSLSEGNPTLFSALKDVFEAEVENKSKKGVVSPSFLVETLKKENELFRSAMHQDAHEFFNFLLNEVIDSLKSFNASNNAVRELFEGRLTNQTKCLTCENVTSRDETFLDLSLDLTDGESLESCLKQFSASEMLSGGNKFYCDNCHSLQEAEKKMGLRKLPNVLALHLKRFKYSEEHRRNVKLFHKMTYPLLLKLDADIPAEKPEDSSKCYELYAIVVHIGGGPHHGHYVALVKTAELGWLLFDDETVEQIDESFVLRFVGDSSDLATAYVMFYQEISKDKYEQEKKKVPLQPTISSKSSQPVMNGFNTEFNLSMRPSSDVKSTTDETDSVSPLDKLAKVPSNDFSINSSQPSTVSSDNKKETTAATTPSVSHKPSTTFGRLVNKPSMASTSSSATTPNGIVTPVTQSSSSLGPQEKQGFWRRADKEKEKEKDKDQAKKKRMSMSFNFKRGG